MLRITSDDLSSQLQNLNGCLSSSNEKKNISYSMHFFSRNHTFLGVVLRDSRFLRRKPTSTPMDFNLRLKMEDMSLKTDVKSYGRLTSRFLYLTTTIPGIMFIVQQLSQKIMEQVTIARLSSKVEYRALTSVACELQWIVYLLRDLHINLSETLVLYCDSQSLLHIDAK
ncbi:hypothetical protein MTR_4g054900 [Medicago truncatula]|uniref:Uncharacterized protein n=1 Tax=Medicago truncatula TaxID=3880 RepID=G7JKV8_MEDTR|nr:hypothetical protein MTR_4g054900 [Medicago truncatula]